MLGSLLLAVTLLEPKTTVSLDKPSPIIGERVVATFTAKIPAGSLVEVESVVTPSRSEQATEPAAKPAESGTPSEPPGGGPVLEYFPLPAAVVEKTSADTWTWKQAIPLAPFVAGDIDVPGPHFVLVTSKGEKVSFRGAAATLKVKTRLPADKKPEELAAKDDRPVRIPARGPWFWGAIAAAVLVAALLVWLLIRRLRRKAQVGEIKPPALPAGPELLIELDKLEKEASTLGDDPRDFYSHLTHAVKRYLERSIDAPVLEWTTFETLRQMREKGFEIPREMGFADLLSAADLVKFGKGRSTRDDAKRHLKNARSVHGHVEAAIEDRKAREAARAAAADGSAKKLGEKR